MARYYFHFKSGDKARTDDDGVDLPDISAATREAEQAARELRHAIKARKPDVPEAVVVTDESARKYIHSPSWQCCRRPSKRPSQ